MVINNRQLDLVTTGWRKSCYKIFFFLENVVDGVFVENGARIENQKAIKHSSYDNK